MADYIIGAGKPRFIIRNKDTGNTVDDITLAYTNESGLVETNQKTATRHTLENDNIVEDIHGYRKSFTLYYDRLLSKADGLKIAQILEYEKLGYDVYLIPRNDNAPYQYKVFFDTDSFDIGILKGKFNAPGNRMVVLKWTATSLVDTMEWTDPSLQTVYTNFLIQPLIIV